MCPTAQVMDGESLSREMLRETTARAAKFVARFGRRACLAAVLVGDDRSSMTYVRMKRARCLEAGIDSRFIHLPESTSTEELMKALDELAQDYTVDGILLQHPVPAHIDERAACEAIPLSKDVDGVTMGSFAAMAFNRPTLASCTPGGIMRLLDHYKVDVAGKHAVVVGTGPILGKPLGMLLLAKNATVTYCHILTRDLAEIVRSADIVVGAAGQPGLIRGSWIKPGAVVIDAGYRDNAGDVAYEEAVEVASLITPVPGGVGPMTIAMLLEQTLDAAEMALVG
jgi:methylenetetrahydrofolate dehydrogenase (NADP+)/methenyltetrahydrofolate cyclohydrolase